jgi:hypothetical protein
MIERAGRKRTTTKYLGVMRIAFAMALALAKREEIAHVSQSRGISVRIVHSRGLFVPRSPVSMRYRISNLEIEYWNGLPECCLGERSFTAF